MLKCERSRGTTSRDCSFFFSSRRRHTRSLRDWSSDVCSSDLQDLLYLVEMLLAADERRSQLDDRVAAVVGAADKPGVEQRLGQEAAQQALGLLVAECLARGLVLDHLDAVEVAGAADVADDRQVVQLLQGGAEPGLVRADVPQQVFLLEDVQV